MEKLANFTKNEFTNFTSLDIILQLPAQMASYVSMLTGVPRTNEKETTSKPKRFTEINAHMLPHDSTKAFDTITNKGKLDHAIAALPIAHPDNLVYQWHTWSPLNTRVSSVEVKKENPGTLLVNYIDPKQAPGEYRLGFVAGALMAVPDIYNERLVVIVWHEDDVNFSVVSLLGEVLHTNKLPTLEPGYIWSSAKYCPTKMLEQLASSPAKPHQATLSFTAYKKGTSTESYVYEAFCILG